MSLSFSSVTSLCMRLYFVICSVAERFIQLFMHAVSAVIMRLSYNRPYCILHVLPVHSSVRLTVFPVQAAADLKTKWRKNKISANVTRGKINQCAGFRFKRSKIKVTKL